jgi:hypothetical protein
MGDDVRRVIRLLDPLLQQLAEVEPRENGYYNEHQAGDSHDEFGLEAH